MSKGLIHLIVHLSDIFGVSDIVHYLIIQLSDISSLSNIVKYSIIQIFDISGMSDVLKHSITIQIFDISSMSDVLKHLIIQLSYISSLSNVFNYLQPFAALKARHEKLPFLGTVCRIHIAHSIHIRSG